MKLNLWFVTAQYNNNYKLELMEDKDKEIELVK